MDAEGRATLRDAARLIAACLTEDVATETEVMNRSDDPDCAWQVAEHAAETAATFLLAAASGDTDHALQILRQYQTSVALGENPPGGA